jgi:hypothetical protein
MRTRVIGEAVTNESGVLVTPLPAWITEAPDGSYRAAQGVLTEDGFFALRLTYAPGYDQSSAAADHTLLNFGTTRLYYDDSEEEFVLDVDGEELRSQDVTFSVSQELTVEVEHTEERRRIRVRGATTGDGPVDGDPMPGTIVESLVVVLGVEAAGDLLALRPINDLTFAELASKRLLSQNDPDGNLRKFAQTLSNGPARIYDVALALRDMLDLVSATGHRLDLIGGIVGLPRNGFDDDRYRTFLSIQTKLLLARARADTAWTGTSANLLEIARTFIGDTGNAIVLTNAPPYAYQLDIPDLTLDEAALLVSFLRVATWAGVRGVITAVLDDGSLWDGDGIAVTDGGIWGSSAVSVTGAAVWGSVISTA